MTACGDPAGLVRAVRSGKTERAVGTRRSLRALGAGKAFETARALRCEDCEGYVGCLGLRDP